MGMQISLIEAKQLYKIAFKSPLPSNMPYSTGGTLAMGKLGEAKARQIIGKIRLRQPFTATFPVK